MRHHQNNFLQSFVFKLRQENSLCVVRAVGQSPLQRPHRFYFPHEDLPGPSVHWTQVDSPFDHCTRTYLASAPGALRYAIRHERRGYETRTGSGGGPKRGWRTLSWRVPARRSATEIPKSCYASRAAKPESNLIDEFLSAALGQNMPAVCAGVAWLVGGHLLRICHRHKCYAHM